MEIIVFGGNGFIGTHLVEELLKEGHGISVFDISPNPYMPEITGVNYHYGRIQDIEDIEKALEGKDMVFHLVSTTVPSTSNQKITFDIESNLIAMIAILDAMKKRDLKRIVYLSSGGTVYGNPVTYPISEEHILEPTSSYGIVKLTIEKYLLLYQNIHGFKPLIIRPANAYGERQNFHKKQGVIAHFLNNILSGKPLEVWGDGKIRRDYIYVGDLVKQMIEGFNQEKTGIFNAGSGEDHSILDIIEFIEEILNKKVDVKFLEGRAYDVEKVKLDINKAQEELNWKPNVSLKEGIRNQYLWMKGIIK